jgi:hypothetical protein
MKENQMTTSTTSGAICLITVFLCLSCDATESRVSEGPGFDGGADGDTDSDADSDADADSDSDADADADTDVNVIPDPTTCAQAAEGHTYLGCDFWPTVTDNIVAPTFDFAVVVANPGDEDAEVTVSFQGEIIRDADVPAHSLVKIYLPWVAKLKSLSWIQGAPDNGCPTWVKTSTVFAEDSAYHLISDRPVAVYQFNAIEYAGKGGPEDKDWTECNTTKNCLGTVDCFSYTNDASLLLPSTALTGNYRIAGPSFWASEPDADPPGFIFPPYFAVTGVEDGTSVTVYTSPQGRISGGGGVPNTPGNGQVTFEVDKGDVVMVVGKETTDFSGTIIKATAPVQVITGISCTQMPHGTEACDHLEETVLPAETLGKRYFVNVPTAPKGTPDTHIVRIVGNVDGTVLSYPGANPGGPATIDSGETVDILGVSQDFEIVGDNEFMVATFQHGQGSIGSPRKGDPAMSFATTVAQYRLNYVFLAPDDYDVSFVDIVGPVDAELILDGEPVEEDSTPISSGYGITRVELGPGNEGTHTLEASEPVGIQVQGYGEYTSYQYPGGLNLGLISSPPVV